MSDLEITIKNLKSRKKEIEEELEYKNNESLNEELYEINDSLNKLNPNRSDVHTLFSYKC